MEKKLGVGDYREVKNMLNETSISDLVASKISEEFQGKCSYTEVKKRVIEILRDSFGIDIQEFENEPSCILAFVLMCTKFEVWFNIYQNDLFSGDIATLDNELANLVKSDWGEFLNILHILVKKKKYEILIEWLKFWKQNFNGIFALNSRVFLILAKMEIEKMQESISESFESEEEIKLIGKVKQELLEITNMLEAHPLNSVSDLI